MSWTRVLSSSIWPPKSGSKLIVFHVSAHRAACDIIVGPRAAATMGRRGDCSDDGFMTALSAC